MPSQPANPCQPSSPRIRTITSLSPLVRKGTPPPLSRPRPESAAWSHLSEIGPGDHRANGELPCGGDAGPDPVVHGRIPGADPFAACPEPDFRLAHATDDLGEVDRLGRKLVVMKIRLV